VFRAILVVLLLLLLLRAVWRLLGGVVQGAMSAGPATGRRPAAPPAVKMARDPICGTYVVPGKALELASGRETMYFCSPRCRDEWLNAR
jgi:YHS domain-containing protein